jgi:hypothetical protein
MKLHQDHAQLAQDLVLRITSNPNFKGSAGEIQNAFKVAFAVAEKYFEAYDAEVERLTASDKPAKKGNGREKIAPKKAEKRAVRKPAPAKKKVSSRAQAQAYARRKHMKPARHVHARNG